MGGSVVAEVASKRLLPSVTCIALLDVVEGIQFNLIALETLKKYMTIFNYYLGYAVEALAGMLSYLRTRPADFDSLERGIKWR